MSTPAEMPPRDSQRAWLGALIACALLYLGAVALPLHDSILRDRKLLATRQRDLEQARSLAGQLASLQATSEVQPTETPVQVVDRCILSLNLADRVTNRRPFGTPGQGVEIKLEELGSPSVSQLLAALAESGVHPSQLELRDLKAQGQWTVVLVIGSSQEGS